jgi:ribose transport system substrate-binding protein
MPTKTVRNGLMTMLAVVLAAGGAGCKKSEPAAPASAEPGAPKTYHFAFVTNNSSDFWNIAEKGVRKAEKDLGIKADVFRPLKTEVSEQQRFIEDILVQNFDGMAICAINPDAMTPLLDRVAAKMPVVVHDSDAPKSRRKAFVGTDNVAAGKLAGQAAIEALKAANISKG